jgi:hypothetical protein
MYRNRGHALKNIDRQSVIIVQRDIRDQISIHEFKPVPAEAGIVVSYQVLDHVDADVAEPGIAANAPADAEITAAGGRPPW